MSGERDFNSAVVLQVNVVAEFLADYHEPPAIDTPGCVFILAGSAILQVAAATFDYLSRWTTPTTLVIAGGKGHSTQLLYNAIAGHTRYRGIASEVEGLPEARVLEHMLKVFWPDLWAKAQSKTLTLLVEPESTNCGENAEFALQIIRRHGVAADTITVVQEPTMSRRTAASLRKHLDDEAGILIKRGSITSTQVRVWPTFIPSLTYQDGKLTWSTDTLPDNEPSEGLWSPERFMDLILGEIPRLRDDAGGYGPQGKGFIPHVDIPPPVIKAYEQLRNTFVTTR